MRVNLIYIEGIQLPEKGDVDIKVLGEPEVLVLLSAREKSDGNNGSHGYYRNQYYLFYVFAFHG